MTEISLQEFFKGDQMKIDVFRSKYLTHPEESVSECFERIASEIASVPIETEKDKWSNIWADEFLSDIWRPGGSIIAGVNKNDKKISLFNCTHIPMKGDSLEDINTCEAEVMKAAAYRQGIGVDFSKLRPRGTKINNSAEESEGIVHWMSSMNYIGFKVGQKGRRPALLLSCRIDHPDVEEVISAKDNVSDLQNTNISIQITDDFMYAVKNDLDWKMHFIVESTGEETTKVIKAKDLYKKLCEHAWISGDPGVQYIDLMNRFSIQKSLGYEIVGTNAPVVGRHRVMTKQGLIPIKDLYERGNSDVLVDSKIIDYTNGKNIYGDVNYVTATFNKYPLQRVVEIELSNGMVLECNEQHQWLTQNGFKKTIDITTNDELLLASEGIWSNIDKNSNDYIDGNLIGWFVGDGFYTSIYKEAGVKRDRKAIGIIWNKDEFNIFDLFKQKYEHLIKKSFNYIRDRKTCFETRTIHKKMYDWFSSFGFNGIDKYFVPEKCFTNKNFAAGFLSGLFGADGSIPENENRITLTTISKDLALNVQQLLFAFGIHSYIGCGDSKSVDYTTVDGVIKQSNYKIRYDVKIGQIENLRRFYDRIGIVSKSKLNKLLNIIECDDRKKEPKILYSKVKKVCFTDRVEDMYCAVVPKHEGLIISGVISHNCSEKPLPEYGVCALASLNMGKVPHLDDMDKFKKFIEEKTYSMVRFMDNVVEYELTHEYKSPIKQQYDVVNDLREIGIGITNLHKWLFDQGFEYDSEDGINAVETFFKYYFYYAFKASCSLAAKRGPCPAYFKKLVRSDMKMEQLESEFLKNIFSEFPEFREMYYNYGIRNGALLSVAPTGSLSMTFSSDIISSGIEPIIGIYYWRRTRAVSRGEWDFYFVLPRVVRNIILNLIEDKESDDYKIIYDFTDGSVLDNDGIKGDKIIKIIKKYLDHRLLKNAFEIDPFKKIEMIGRVQKYVDAAISVTFNVPNSFTKEDTENIYMKAYDKNIKAMTIFREGVKDGIIFFEFPKSNKVKTEVKIEPTIRPKDIQYVFAPSRPKKLPCEIYKVLGHHVIVGLMGGKPYEMFITEANGRKFPETGSIVKVRRAKYRLVDDNDSTLIENMIDDLVANEEIQAITRLTSASLRHGVPIDFICEQLSKCGDSISSYPKMLGRVLKKFRFLVLENTSSEKCPNCGEPLVNSAGCYECVNCSYSKCA